MGYWISRFGGVALPKYLPRHDNGAGPAADGFVALPDGSFYDAYGASRAPRAPTDIKVSLAAVAATPEALTALLRNLRALHRTRAKLWRTWATENGEALEWTWARLVDMPAEREADMERHLPLELTFRMLSPDWYGERHGVGWTFDDGEYFDDGLYFDSADDTLFNLTSPIQVVTVPNNGHVKVNNVVITITAAGSPITAVEIEHNAFSLHHHLKYDGAIAVGQSLVIDCGAQSVKNNGVEDYANFSLDNDHESEEWFTLFQGDTEVTVLRTGGNGSSTARFAYSDGWI